jgi:CTP:phosphocholine cytidylyltransferase-like protein
MDYQVIVVDSEDALQISIHNLETVTSKYRSKISKSKTKQWLLKEEIQ